MPSSKVYDSPRAVKSLSDLAVARQNLCNENLFTAINRHAATLGKAFSARALWRLSSQWTGEWPPIAGPLLSSGLTGLALAACLPAAT